MKRIPFVLAALLLVGCDSDGVDLNERITIRVSGNVTSKSGGAAIQGAKVELFQSDYGFDPTFAATTSNASGAYSISWSTTRGDCPFELRLSFTSDGFKQTQIWDDDPDLFDEDWETESTVYIINGAKDFCKNNTQTINTSLTPLN